MDIYSVIVVSVILLLTAAGLLLSHVWAWRAFQQQPLDAEELDFRRRQFRRRMHTSATLGLLAVAVLGGYVLTWWLHSAWFALVFWTAVMALACWVMLLAAMDIWATKRHFGRLRQHYVIEQAKLEAQIRRIQALRGNGKGEVPMRQQKSRRREGGVE